MPIGSSFTSRKFFSGRIPELDGLRGVAIAMVLFFHYFFLTTPAVPGSPLAYLLAAGRLAWSGVDLFFVLSGFLIGGILIDARHSHNYFSVFYTRRFFRIIPIYTLLLTTFYLFSIIASGPLAGKFSWIRKDELPWYPHILFLQNIWMAFRNSAGTVYGLAVTWSLAVEEQFYLTLPLVVRFISFPWLVPALLTGAILAPACRIGFYMLWPGHAYSWFALMPCRADALLLGVLGALALRNENYRLRLTFSGRLLSIVILMLAFGMIFLTKYAPSVTSPLMLSVGFSWLAVFYLSVLLYALTQQNSLISWVLRWKLLRWLGAIAYGTYLFHEFVLGVVFGLFRSHTPTILTLEDVGLSLGALALTILLCSLSWNYFEQSLVSIGHRTDYLLGMDNKEI